MSKDNVVKLSKPIEIDGKSCREIRLRDPKAGELRGLNLANVMQMDTDAMLKLLPRICTLSGDQIADMPAADFAALSTTAISFFVPASVAAEIQAIN